jgi:predicted ATP-grasp superfamily ATP-dependent carboligase
MTETIRFLRGASAPVRGVLLTCGDHLGTLAAARDLGRMGVRVLLADADEDSLTARSRFVDRQLALPRLDRPREWLAALLEFGRREPGHVLLPTSDDVCWLLDANRERLEPWFRLYQPPAGGTWQLLNKRLLHAHCRAVGLPLPRQWPADVALTKAATLPYPVIVKPCTQAGMRRQVKGVVVHEASELRGAIERVRDGHGWHPEMLKHDPSVQDLIVQAFHADAERDIYSLSGFYAPETGTYVLRASQKVLQQPLRIGVGLCFESRPVDFELARQLRALFDRVGYRGAFEAEFLSCEGRRLLIDANPRFFGQMAFDIARGLSAPQLCWFAALGRWDEVRRVAMMARVTDMQPVKSCHPWMLKLYATTHLIGGTFGLDEWRYWLDWAGEGTADFVDASDDPQPAARLRRSVGRDLVLRPRSTLRKFFVR